MKFSFFYYLQEKVDNNSIYLEVSVTVVGSAIVIKYHFVLLQTLAVCKNFNLGVSVLYLASNSYTIETSSSAKMISFDEIFLYSK